MTPLKTTEYFRTTVIDERPEVADYLHYVIRAIESPIATETQADGRIRHWIYVPEEDKYFRVVTLADGETIHNAMFDRNFKRRMNR